MIGKAHTMRWVATAIAIAASLAASAAQPALGFDARSADTREAARQARSPDGWQAVKAATARYHSFKQAKRDGYTIAGEPCVASPAGAMGIHAVNRALEADAAIDPLRPEILLYVPKRNGKLRLVGLEYLKYDADQNLATNDDRPALFGQPFDGPMEGHGPGMPVHYDLHVWVWKANPSGLFAPFNPSVSC